MMIESNKQVNPFYKVTLKNTPINISIHWRYSLMNWKIITISAILAAIIVANPSKRLIISEGYER